MFRFSLQAALLSSLGIFNLFLTYFPLTDVIGYEFSVLNGIILFIFSSIYAIKYYRSHFLSLNEPFIIFRNSKIFLISLILIPFFIGSLSSIIFSTCPLLNGLIFYFVIALPNILFGISTGYFIFSLCKKFTYLIFILVFLFILFSPIIEIYFYPQVFFYNTIIGFFPGTIYDEDIKVDLILISYRILNILFFMGLLFLGKGKNENVKIFKWVTLPLVIVTIVGFMLAKPILGFSTDFTILKNKLAGGLETEHFRIYYSKDIGDNNSIELLGLMHEYYYEQVNNQLNVSLDKKIISFVFKDENQKRKLFGAGKADVAKPWLNQIYINYPTYEETLKHEIVHVISGVYGAGPFRVADNINPALIEGFAMAIENDYDEYPIHYMAKLAYQAGYKFPIEKLFGGLNFFSSFASVSYIYSGSFVKFLIEKYGIEKAKKLYGNLDFNAIYGYELSDLVMNYYRFLDELTINFNRNKAQLYFGGQPIFKKFCPRSAANQTKAAWQLSNKGNYSRAAQLFRYVYNYSSSYSSLNGLINTLIKMSKFSYAELFLKKEINKFIKSSYFYNLELTLSDINICTNNLSSALTIYDSLLAQNPHIAYSNQVLIRKLILSNGLDSLKSYLNSEPNKKIDLLLKLNKSEVIYYTIPTIINLCTEKSCLKKILSYFKERIEVYDFASCNSAYILSIAALKVKDYNSAKQLGIKALRYKNDQYFSFTLSENLKKINWLNNFSSEVINRFHYQ